ncbi:MAG: two-component system phosphate regulon sensor histidine kinase PhoR, partial [Bradymonadia bacterium]
ELRTPVSVIRATAETLVDGALDAGPEIARGFVDAILRNSERLTRLISDLLDISKIDSGHYQTRIVATDIEAVVRKAHQSIDLPENTHQVTLAFEADVTAMSDAAALEQVFVNLIENAIKYTPPGSRVDVTAAVEDANVIVRVADNGPGVDARHRDRLFERFYRVDAGRSREKGGTGLGLSIVKNLVQSMGGTVGVSANEPRGCVFWVSLPRPSTGAGS